MGYLIKCSDCKEATWASNIVNLIANHTESNGKLKCTKCNSSNASIYCESKLQEKDEYWTRYIKGVIPIQTDVETYTPYVFLTGSKEDGDVDGIHFNYFKDTRKEEGGRLKHGHGPGGAPVLSKDELFQLLGRLLDFGCMSLKDIEDFLNNKAHEINRRT